MTQRKQISLFPKTKFGKKDDAAIGSDVFGPTLRTKSLITRTKSCFCSPLKYNVWEV